jgi:hypothetical protein
MLNGVKHLDSGKETLRSAQGDSKKWVLSGKGAAKCASHNLKGSF